MLELIIRVPTKYDAIENIRPALDEALAREFPGGMLQRCWEGSVLHLSGPGAVGTIVLEEGELVGRATLAPPASLLRALIETKVGSAMRQAAGLTA